ncbi:pyridoxal-phosphate dependent enzyme [bacterium]|nr:pyridoxal-phosphate dependent enzyme [bacterium]
MTEHTRLSAADTERTAPTIAPPTIADVYEARRVIGAYLPRTPLHHYPMLDQLLGAQVYVKHENYQPIGAFKIRGGINFMAHLPEDQRRRGVATASTGNHGQSVAYAAQLFGAQAVIVVPENANPVKVDAMRSLGADVRLLGDDFEAAKRHGARVAEAEGLRWVSSGDEPHLISGVATHTLEILEDLPDVDVILVPVGGGSGAAGAALVAKSLNPAIRVIGVQAAASPAAFLTWQARAHREAENRTFAEGLATGAPFMMPQRVLWQHLDDFILVDDDGLRQAVRFYLEKAKTLSEPAGAAPLAAAFQIKEQLAGKKIALILSGGNISPEQLRQCLA